MRTDLAIEAIEVDGEGPLMFNKRMVTSRHAEVTEARLLIPEREWCLGI